MAVTPETTTPPEPPDAARAAIADFLRQFILLITSLAFTNAFTGLLRPSGSEGTLMPRLGGAAMTFHPDSAAAAAEPWASLPLFAIYILVGTRFVLVNWIYLSTLYGEASGSARQPRIAPDAVSIFLTGIGIGLLSYYCSAGLSYGFFVLLAAILLIDALCSLASLSVNRESMDEADRRSAIVWLANNLGFGLACLGLVLRLDWPTPPGAGAYRLLMALAALNCAVSLANAYAGYLAAKPRRRRHEMRLRRETDRLHAALGPALERRLRELAAATQTDPPAA